MKLKTYVITLVAALAIPTISYAQSVLVDDPGFEDGFNLSRPITGLPIVGGVQEYTATGTPPSSPNISDISGTSQWYASTGTVSLVNQGILGAVLGPLVTGDSSQYLVLNDVSLLGTALIAPVTLGGVSQSVATTAGLTYTVNYQVGGLALTAGGTANKGVLAAGVDGVTNFSSPTSLLSVNVGSFTNQSFTFTANSSNSVLDFYEPSALLAGVGGIAIDNISVTAVPEPKDALVIVLLLGVAFNVIRKRSEKTKAICI